MTCPPGCPVRMYGPGARHNHDDEPPSVAAVAAPEDCGVRGCPVRLGLSSDHRHPEPADPFLERWPNDLAILDEPAPEPPSDPDPTVMRLAAVIRVSTEDQERSGAGLAAQRAAIANGEAQGRYSVASWHSDTMSGAKDDRPGLNAALEEIRAGRADGLVVAKLDRLTRSLLAFATLMAQSRQEGWHIVALDLGVDTSTPSGEMMANVLATFAQFERRMISQRTRDALAQKRAQGVRLGRPVVTAPAVRARMAELHAEGLGSTAIATRLNSDGVPPNAGAARWHHGVVEKMLHGRNGGPCRCFSAPGGPPTDGTAGITAL